MLSEISQTKKDKFPVILLVCTIYNNPPPPEKKQAHRYRKSLVVGGVEG